MEGDDLAGWKVRLEEPVMSVYKGIEVYKLDSWVQGPVMLQALNMLETLDLRNMGFNSARYIHTLYQVMNLAFADRDFYYGDPYFPPQEPIRGLLSKEYAKQRLATLNPDKNDPSIRPGDPYPFEGKSNPYLKLLEGWHIFLKQSLTFFILVTCQKYHIHKPELRYCIFLDHLLLALLFFFFVQLELDWILF